MEYTNVSSISFDNSSNILWLAYLTTALGESHYHSPVLSMLITTAVLTVGYLSSCSYRNPLFSISPAKLKFGGANDVPTVPYWIPYLGLLIPFSYDSDALLNTIINKFSWGIFALKLAGSRHYMIIKPSLAGKILEKARDVTYGDVLFDVITL
ncbi:MAG: hypothetical protein Q9184_006292, partial [Pyrenodesmia sp. 2 TL-2023]